MVFNFSDMTHIYCFSEYFQQESVLLNVFKVKNEEIIDRVNLETYLNILAVIGDDVDVTVDAVNSIAYCGTRLTAEGKKEFQDCLKKCYIKEGSTIEWDNDDTDDEEGISSCANQAFHMLTAMAGYCKDYSINYGL